MALDAFTTEVITNALATVADEMAVTIVRTAHSALIREAMDFSTAICDAAGDVVVQSGASIPIHIGSIPDAMASIKASFAANVRDGDVYLLNDPFDGGSHLPDIFVITPLFCRGDHMGYAVTVAHHADVGGRVLGSISADNTDIYQEGIRLGPVRLYDGGVANEALFRVLERNVRLPEMLFGDLGAQIAACRIGQRGLAELEARYGAAELREYEETLLARTEQLTRLAIGKLPDGEHTFTDYIDDDGLGSGPLPIVARVRITGDTIAVDFTGSAPQVRGAINATASYTKSAVYLALKTALDDEIPTNAGFFRPITVTVPAASILNVAHPGSCGNRGVTGYRATDAVFGALAQVLPGSVRAAGEGGTTSFAFGGRLADGRSFSVRESLLGAWGGGRDRDGVDAISSAAANISNTPAEVLEAEYPVAVETYGLVADSGGAGTHRGGLALVRELRYCADEGQFFLRADRQKFRPYPLAGGSAGTPSRVSLVRDGIERKLPAKISMGVQRGDVIRVVIPGAAGWGPPLARDPELVLADMRAEKISVKYARRIYGVVVEADPDQPTNPASIRLDVQATKRLRQRLERTRGSKTNEREEHV
jgi:N-methylhydantoinase B